MIVKNDRSAAPTDGRGVAAQRSSSHNPAELKRPAVAKVAATLTGGMAEEIKRNLERPYGAVNPEAITLTNRFTSTPGTIIGTMKLLT